MISEIPVSAIICFFEHQQKAKRVPHYIQMDQLLRWPWQLWSNICLFVDKTHHCSYSILLRRTFPLAPTTLTGLSATNPCHVIRAVLSGRAHWVSSEGGPVLQLGGEELQATGTCWYRLPRRRQAHHPTLDTVWSVALPPHVHGVSLRPLLRGEGGGVAQAVMIRLMRRR